jgi:hypothetical protein
MANGTLAASQIEMESLSGTGIITITPPATDTNRAITLPDAAGQVVLNSATQTLTNKTIQGGAITAATAVTASGTSVDFTSIPSWVKRITVMFDIISTNGTAVILVQLGDSGGVETTGYDTNAAGVGNAGAIGSAGSNFTTGFALTPTNAAASQYHGNIVFNNITGNTWVSSGVLVNNSTGAVMFNSGKKTLSDTLTQVRITTVNGTDAFDAGTINIMYEG